MAFKARWSETRRGHPVIGKFFRVEGEHLHWLKLKTKNYSLRYFLRGISSCMMNGTNKYFLIIFFDFCKLLNTERIQLLLLKKNERSMRHNWGRNYFFSIHHAHTTKIHIKLADQATAFIDGGGGPKMFMK